MSRFEYGCQSEIICNDNQIYPAMKELVEDEGKTVYEASVFVENLTSGSELQHV